MQRIAYIIRRALKMDHLKSWRLCRAVAKRSHRLTFFVLVDVCYCAFRYGAGVYDYYCSFFERLNRAQRASFITRAVNVRYAAALNDPEESAALQDKLNVYQKIGPYMGRPYLLLNEENEAELAEFLRQNPSIVVKPLKGASGYKIERIDTVPGENVGLLYQRLLQNGQRIVERCITQNHEMSRLCASAVNTLRVVTVRKDSVCHIMGTILRIGGGKSHLDNFKSDGLAAIVGQDGRVLKPAVDQKNRIYHEHPVSGVQIVGFQVPFFQQALEMVREASALFPKVGYLGWDVAFTDDGPLLIEVNHIPGYHLLQSPNMTDGHRWGEKPRFDAVIYGSPSEKIVNTQA